jgi:hypothetical protein
VKRLTDGEVEQAADLLSAARRGRVTMAGLPPPLIPEHTADVQRIINRVSDGIVLPVRGWKTYTVRQPAPPPSRREGR